MSQNILESAVRLWQESAREFEPSEVVECDVHDDPDPTATEGVADSLQKVSRWLDHVVTKLGACAAVADERESEGLKSMAAEVIKAYIAAIGTMISLRRGAGVSLCTELQQAGQELASSLEEFGASIGKASMARAAGRALDRANRLALISTCNSAAIKKRLMACLEQLRSGHMDLKDVLQESEEEKEEFSDEDAVFDASLDSEERQVAEAASVTVSLLEDVLEESIVFCSSPSNRIGFDAASGAKQERMVKLAISAVDTIDGMVASIIGGLEKMEVAQSLKRLNEALGGLRECGFNIQAVEDSLKDVQAALEKVED